VSVATASWVVGSATGSANFTSGRTDKLAVNYGLFEGTMEVTQWATAVSDVKNLRGDKKGRNFWLPDRTCLKHKIIYG
jgi:hypothetical protein